MENIETHIISMMFILMFPHLLTMQQKHVQKSKESKQWSGSVWTSLLHTARNVRNVYFYFLLLFTDSLRVWPPRHMTCMYTCTCMYIFYVFYEQVWLMNVSVCFYSFIISNVYCDSKFWFSFSRLKLCAIHFYISFQYLHLDVMKWL